jgi:CRISPR-associated endonuclease Csn1
VNCFRNTNITQLFQKINTMKKNILGLDLGTNSIGWALVSLQSDGHDGTINGLGSRILPMDQSILGEFERGNSVSQTAERTRLRIARRLHERYLLRRERLHRALNVLGFLPQHYASKIDFTIKKGQFFPDEEPKLAYSDRQFIFKESFDEMLAEFRKEHPAWLSLHNRHDEPMKIPYDWTLYYLRKKALSFKITKEELAWLLLNFNQKRGYNQARGEEDERSNIREYVELLSVLAVSKREVDKKNPARHWYHIELSNGWTYDATFSSEPQWLNQEKEFLVTEELDEEGKVKVVKDKRTDSTGKPKRKITPLPSFEEIDRMPQTEKDKIYAKIKAKTEITILNSGKTVGEYIYLKLLEKPNQKLNGKLIRTIDRKFYRDELVKILERQTSFHPELQDPILLQKVGEELYANNEGHQQMTMRRNLQHLFTEDIVFYQRPLKSQKSTLGDCPFETRKYQLDGQWLSTSLKVIPKSNPYYQEFRVWQWLQNLKIKLKEDEQDVTAELIDGPAAFEEVFHYLMTQKEIDQKTLLKFLLGKKGLKGNAVKDQVAKYRWNYVYDSEKDESKFYPCNETGFEINKRLGKTLNVPDGFLTKEKEYQLWHIIYSISNRDEYAKAIETFARKNNLDAASFKEAFLRFPPFRSEYGSFSEKAIKKLLPLMRLGNSWSWEAIDSTTKDRIGKILSGEYDETIKEKVRLKALHLNKESDFQGLPLWLASYIVYNRHAEGGTADKWAGPHHIDAFLTSFRQHSLRNPIVEQVVTETLRMVRDIWVKFGGSQKNFFNEIHVELGREMKNTMEERKRLTKQVSENEQANQRIRLLLLELLNDPTVENVRPHSPSQQELLKLYEEGALNSEEEMPDYVLEIIKKFNEADDKKKPTPSDITRYKLWLDQKYHSPYTGLPISLSRLFTEDYEIEHIIPQSRFFDDSLSNKVICEAVVNARKGNQLGFEFIRKHGGEQLEASGKTFTILTTTEYERVINRQFQRNRAKRNKLMREDIPEKMIERQMNDTRYISRYICSLLSNIVREEANDDGVNSKNVIPSNGKVTAALRKDWRLDQVWNALILPRFERMNQLTQTALYTTKTKEGHIIPTVPLELLKGFQKKRIDHRHHALDALVIACTTRDHINLLNNQSANSPLRYDLQHKLRETEGWVDDKGKPRTKFSAFKMPWASFHKDTKGVLEEMIVSFKQNLRVINKATNYYEKWEVVNGKKVKVKKAQAQLNWAIRKPLSKDTVSGKIHLPRIKLPKGKILTATRKSLNGNCDLKTIESITDTGIQKILRNYLMQERFRKKDKPVPEYDAELAFSPEGIEELNRTIHQYNNGKPHQPIYKFRVFEIGSKFPLGQTGNKRHKYVEAAKGTNLFFAIYADEYGKRNYDTIPLNLVIERLKQGLPPVPQTNERGHHLIMHLSPNDLVYIPDLQFDAGGESGSTSGSTSLVKSNRVYKMVSCSGSECYFVQANFAYLIKQYDPKSKMGELGSKNKQETTIITPNLRIKEHCIKIAVDRLGTIIDKKMLHDASKE